MYGWESWIMKKAELWRIDAFELWCWRRLLRVPWTARRSKQSILKENNSEYSPEGLILKFQCFGHLMPRANSLEKTLMMGKIEGKRRRGWQRMRWLDGLPTQWAWVWTNSRRWWRTGKPGVSCSSRSPQSWTQLSDWTTTKANERLESKNRLPRVEIGYRKWRGEKKVYQPGWKEYREK